MFIEKILNVCNGGKAVPQIDAIGEIPSHVTRIAGDARASGPWLANAIHERADEIAIGPASHVMAREIPVHSQKMSVRDQICRVQRTPKKPTARLKRRIEFGPGYEHLGIVVGVVSGNAQPAGNLYFERRVRAIRAGAFGIEKASAESRAIGVGN